MEIILDVSLKKVTPILRQSAAGNQRDIVFLRVMVAKRKKSEREGGDEESMAVNDSDDNMEKKKKKDEILPSMIKNKF